jgi:hypothetical protein
LKTKSVCVFFFKKYILVVLKAKMLKRFTAPTVVKASSCLTVAAQSTSAVRNLHFPLTPAPMPITYLDSDPLEFALRTEARHFGMDDGMYVRELAFCRINDNPTVGDFRNAGPEGRRKIFHGSTRQDFFRWLTYKLCGTPEHLYHEGW